MRQQTMDSINYSSENQEPEQPEHDLAGIGRSYDCVYCKRGFNTAQALGGHMNIHRKDRAARNPKPNNNLNDTTTSSFNPNKAAAGNLDRHNNTTLNVPMYYHHQVSTGGRGSHHPPPPAFHHHQASQLSYRTYFPASTSTPVFANHHYYSYNTLDCDDVDGDGDNPPCLDLFGEDWRRRLSLSLHHVDDVEKIDDGGVDLELRLGHDR